MCLFLFNTTFSNAYAVPPAPPQTGTWTYDQYFDGAAQAWIARVTSTVNRVMDCTITWSGFVNGQNSGGNQAMRLPAYPGFGAAIVGHLGFKVGNFQGHANCAVVGG
jgi:hypothetical protein